MESSDDKLNEKIVISLGGDTMAGVFGCGVLAGLERQNFYNKIHSIHAASIGSLNGAYFLTEQSETAARIYYEDLTSGFIQSSNHVFIGALKRYWKRYIGHVPKNEINHAVNFPKLFEVFTKEKSLNFDKLSRSEIPLYVRLFDIEVEVETLHDLRNKEKALNILEASIDYLDVAEISGKKYSDAGILDPIGLSRLLERYPNRKIVVINNVRPFRNFFPIFDILEAFILESEYQNFFGPYLDRGRKLQRDLRRAKKRKDQILMIYPPKRIGIKPFTTDPEVLKNAYEAGKREAKRIIAFCE